MKTGYDVAAGVASRSEFAFVERRPRSEIGAQT
jgi:hypothetical protein